MIYQIVDTRLGNQCIRIGFHRLNRSYNGIIYIIIFIENCTQMYYKITDLILGIDKDDDLVYASGVVEGIKINNSSEGMEYAVSYLIDFKSMLTNIVSDDIEAVVNELLINDREHSLVYSERTLFNINGMTYNAYTIMLRPVNQSINEINTTITLAELIPNTWFLVYLKTTYEDVSVHEYMIQEYKLVELKI